MPAIDILEWRHCDDNDRPRHKAVARELLAGPGLHGLRAQFVGPPKAFFVAADQPPRRVERTKLRQVVMDLTAILAADAAANAEPLTATSRRATAFLKYLADPVRAERYAGRVCTQLIDLAPQLTLAEFKAYENDVTARVLATRSRRTAAEQLAANAERSRANRAACRESRDGAAQIVQRWASLQLPPGEHDLPALWLTWQALVAELPTEKRDYIVGAGLGRTAFYRALTDAVPVTTGHAGRRYVRIEDAA